MKSLSVVILSHNQAQEVAALASSLKTHAQQIIVLDDNSSDDIVVVCKNAGAELYQHDLADDFAAHRNWIFPHISCDWTLFLDADESLSPELLQEILESIQVPERDAILIPRHDIFLGKQLRYGETATIALLRCAKTKLSYEKWERPVHEVWRVSTKRIATTKNVLLHRPHTDLTSMLSKFHRYARLEAKLQTKKSGERAFFELLVFPIAKFFLNYVIRFGCRDGWRGFIHAWMMAYLSLVTRIYIFELRSS